MAKTLEMTSGRPFPLIIKFALPLILGNILQQTYSLVDAAIVGRNLDIQSLAAIGASSSVMFFILGFCNGCGAGFGIPIAQKFGARDYSTMRRYVNTCIKIAAVLSLLITAITTLLCRNILQWLHTPSDVMDGAYIYLLITFAGIPATFFYNLLSSIIRALGDSKTPFYFLIISTILNIGLDFLLILGFGFGVGGASAATLLAQLISTLACWIYMQRSFPILKSTPQEKRFNWNDARHLLNVGVPMGLQFSITAIGSMMLQNANNTLGTTCAAAFTTAMRIKMFFMCPFETLGIAMATFCGQNYGAGKTERILHGVKDTFIIMISYAAITFAIIWPSARWMGTFFMDSGENEVLDKTELFLHCSVTFYTILGTLCILRYCIQGVGYTKLAMFSGVAEMVARVLVSVFAVPTFGYIAVCLGDPSAWFAADMFLIPAFIWVWHQIRPSNHLDSAS